MSDDNWTVYINNSRYTPPTLLPQGVVRLLRAGNKLLNVRKFQKLLACNERRRTLVAVHSSFKSSAELPDYHY